ncbi:AlpA family transcriptional regulator [Shewanella sp. JM162201]|uniref:AlpA family transcriptional regulator n=1 Tax=Shewanella jiangmenensis TaxID=2837387 RepID=A0ABS5V9M5_9GAMM|nr:AlpA family transcriptional regulator [Shewanella jiangmenensis]MBT1446356.1 AlpA family transcriptional regulator [Shewanella jiangmenensis]
MKLIRLKKVSELTGLGRSSIYNYMNEDRFPKSVKLGPRLVAWVEEEVQAWIMERVVERE